MSDAFVFRLMLVIIAIVILIALVVQYNKNKAADGHQEPSPHKEGFQQPQQRAPVAAEPMAAAPVAADKYVNPKGNAQPDRMMAAPQAAPAVKKVQKMSDPEPFESMDTEMYRALDYKPEDNGKPQADPFPKDRLTKADLLPKDAANTKWAQVNPAGQGDLENVNLLDAGWNFGIDTQGQTLKNPNLQIRSEFPNPRADIGPWNQSTIEKDVSRRYFEIGQP